MNNAVNHSQSKLGYKGVNQTDDDPESEYYTSDTDTESTYASYNENIWRWIRRNPKSKLSFFFFVLSIFAIVALTIFYFMDKDSAFIASGAFALILTCYAWNHFRTLLGLRHEIDSFVAANKQFRTENHKLHHKVTQLNQAKNELKNVREGLQNINLRTKQNNLKFRQLQQNLHLTVLDNIDGIDSIRNKVTKISDEWKQNLIHRERHIICRLYDRMEDLNQRNGISRDGFDGFVDLLPDSYGKRFKRMGTFNKLAAGKSVIDCEDLRVCLDVFADMDVNDCDIDFKIDKIPRKNQSGDGKDKLFMRQVSILTRSQPCTKITAGDINVSQFSDDDDDDFEGF